MNVLSLFDGISCGQESFRRLGVLFNGKENTYYASEIKKPGIKCALSNFPNTIEIGDVTQISFKDGVLYTEKGNFNVGQIDVLIGGSPCQDFSQARILSNKTIEGLKGQKSSLFYEYLRLLNEVKPKYFLLENVKMKQKSKEELDRYLGVVGKEINSNLVSFQNRSRNYWSNLPFTQPADRYISFQDYKDTDPNRLQQAAVSLTPSRIRMWNNGRGRENMSSCPNITNAIKVGCLTRKQDRCPNSGLIEYKDFCRYLTKAEIELAQTLPVGYTDCLSYNQTQDVCGDGWTVDVIAWILSYLPIVNGNKYRNKFNA